MPISPDIAVGQRPRWPEWRLIIALSLMLVAGLSLPYLLAVLAGPEHVFAGILANPVDGQTYLAKMRQGWRGAWMFTLPYTAEPGPGVVLFTYHLWLGHVARWVGAPLGMVYHAARSLGALAMLLAAYYFISRVIGGRRARLAAWLLFALGSGLGWLAVPFGAFTADLWVAEAIPFLAAFVNAHFALATALLLLLLAWTLPGLAPPRPRPAHLLGVALVATALAQVQPMALLSVGVVLAGAHAWQFVVDRCWRWQAWLPAGVVAMSAAPWLIYDASLTLTHSALAAWNAQNQTPSPPLWDTLLSGGVLLGLAAAGLVLALRRGGPINLALAAWLIFGGLSLYAPFALQRRLSLGLWMPLVLLGFIGLRDGLWPRLPARVRPLAAAGLGLLLLPSNLLVYAATLGAVAARDPMVFLSRAEVQALNWLDANAPAGALVVAAPETALFVPAWTDARVFYGHPFETVAAEAQRQAVEAFYAGHQDRAVFVETRDVDYVLYGPREQALADDWEATGWREVYNAAGVVIYAP